MNGNFGQRVSGGREDTHSFKNKHIQSLLLRVLFPEGVNIHEGQNWQCHLAQLDVSPAPNQQLNFYPKRLTITYFAMIVEKSERLT